VARAEFGGGASDFTFSRTTGGLVRLGAATLTMWDSEFGGTQYTDLVINGSPASSVAVASDGQVPSFHGPDGVYEMWADAGGGRVQMEAAADMVASAAAIAVQARDEAVQAKVAAEGVGAIVDTQIASRVNDPASATSAAVARQVPSKQPSAGEMGRGQLRAILGRTFPGVAAATRDSGGTGATSIPNGTVVPSVDGGGAVASTFRYLRANPIVSGEAFPDAIAVKGAGNSQYVENLGLLVEFIYDGTDLEALVKNYGVAGNGGVRVTVDGLLMPPPTGEGDANGFARGYTVSGDTVARIRYTLPSSAPAKPRLWRIEGIGEFRFFGVGAQFGTAVSPYVDNPGPRVIVFGDSYTEGAMGGGGETNYGATHASYAAHAGRLLGWRDLWSSGSGGTGYLQTASIGTGRPKLRDRFAADLYPYAPDVVGISMGHNDLSGFTTSQVVAEAGLALDDIVANLPNAAVFVVGPLDGSGNTAASNSYTAMSDALAAMCVARGVPYVDPIRGEWITAANKATYIGTDNVHPTAAGHRYLGRRLAASLAAFGFTGHHSMSLPVTVPIVSKLGSLGSVQVKRRTAGNVSFVSSASGVYTPVDTGLDLTLAAKAGDVLRIELSALVGNQAGDLEFNVATMVGGAPVNYAANRIAGVTASVTGWYTPGGVMAPLSGSIFYDVQAGDLSGGTITLRLLAKNGTTARTIYGASNLPLMFAAQNLG
jgi:lysophospholipase L1-like esterase